MDNTTPTPDNMIGKFSRIYKKNNQFTTDDGKNIEYARLALAYQVNGKELELEVKIHRKDWVLLGLADTVSGNTL